MLLDYYDRTYISDYYYAREYMDLEDNDDYIAFLKTIDEVAVNSALADIRRENPSYSEELIKRYFIDNMGDWDFNWDEVLQEYLKRDKKFLYLTSYDEDTDGLTITQFKRDVLLKNLLGIDMDDSSNDVIVWGYDITDLIRTILEESR